jgi:hypothetical protein
MEESSFNHGGCAVTSDDGQSECDTLMSDTQMFDAFSDINEDANTVAASLRVSAK